MPGPQPLAVLEKPVLTKQFEPAGIQSQEDEKEHGEGPERGTPIAEKGQRNSYYGKQADGHTYVHHEVYHQDGYKAVTEDPAERRSLTFC